LDNAERIRPLPLRVNSSNARALFCDALTRLSDVDAALFGLHAASLHVDTVLRLVRTFSAIFAPFFSALSRFQKQLIVTTLGAAKFSSYDEITSYYEHFTSYYDVDASYRLILATRLAATTAHLRNSVGGGNISIVVGQKFASSRSRCLVAPSRPAFVLPSPRIVRSIAIPNDAPPRGDNTRRLRHKTPGRVATKIGTCRSQNWDVS